MIRKIIEVSKADLNMSFDGATLGEKLLAPTRIYVKSLLQLHEKVNIHALSHITGGGLLENIPRVLPENVTAIIDSKSWQRPAVFDWLQQQGNVVDREMYRTFNNGIGMVVCVAEQDADATVQILTALGETAMRIGHIENSDSEEQVIIK